MADLFQPHADLVISDVATAPSPATSGTSLVVTSGDGTNFPAPGTNGYYCTVWPTGQMPTKANAEIIKVTGKATDTLTIVRAQAGTTARSIDTTYKIAVTITIKSLNDIENILNTPTTKGDILVYTGSAYTRLGVGTNTQVLTADSTQSSGIKWADAAAGGGGGGVSLTDEVTYYSQFFSPDATGRAAVNFGGTVTMDSSEYSLLWSSGGTSGVRGGIDFSPTNGYTDFNSLGDWMLQFMVRPNMSQDSHEAWWGMCSNFFLSSDGTSSVLTTANTGIYLTQSGGGSVKNFSALNANGTASTQTSITPTNTNGLYNVFSIVKTSSNIKFYEKGSLKATHSTNMQSGTFSKIFRGHATTRTATGTCNFYVHFVNYRGKMV